MKNRKSPVIFIIDENKAYAKLVEAYLKIDGYSDIHTFQNTEECIDLLDQTDIVVTEFQNSRSKIQGHNLIKTIKAKNSETDLIFFTSNSNVETAIKAIRAGAVDYIIKSKYAPVKLLHRVNSIVKYKKELGKNRSVRTKLLTLLGLLLVLMGCLIFFYTH